MEDPHGKWHPTRGVSYVSCRSAEITPGMHENGNAWWIYFQMTTTSNSGICTCSVSIKMLAGSVLLQLAGLHVLPLGEPRHMNRKLTPSHGTPRRWEKFGSGEPGSS